MEPQRSVPDDFLQQFEKQQTRGDETRAQRRKSHFSGETPKTENFKNVDDKLHGEEERDDKSQTREGESLDTAISVLKNAAEQHNYGQSEAGVRGTT